MTWARRSLRSGSLRSVVALATFAAVAVACDRSAEVGSAPDASEFVDTSMRIDGDRLTLRHGVGPRLVGDAIPLLVIAEPSDGAVATIELPDDGRLGPFEFAIRPAPRPTVSDSSGFRPTTLTCETACCDSRSGRSRRSTPWLISTPRLLTSAGRNGSWLTSSRHWFTAVRQRKRRAPRRRHRRRPART